MGFDFTLAGADLDDDGLVDFGYTYWFDDMDVPNSQTGPVVVAPGPMALGAEDAFDVFSDPNLLPAAYVSTYWFGGDPFAQFYLALWGLSPWCPYPGASGNYCSADIDCGWYPCDCIVGLGDLGVLLATYGLCPGDPGYNPAANLNDHDGTGCINLADLGVLLAQYGDDCNVP
jgi:hypothetical protein